jgi:hypothetical protein
MSVTVEFVGGPKDGEVCELWDNIPELRLPVFQPTILPSGNQVEFLADPVPTAVMVYRRRGGPHGVRLDGVLLYDYEPQRAA